MRNNLNLMSQNFIFIAGPYKRHSVSVITEILKDVLTCYLQHETYEAEWSRQMTKTLCEVSKISQWQKFFFFFLHNQKCLFVVKCSHR